MQEDHPIVDWREGVPVAVRFEDPYFSLSDGLAETRQVFLAGNGLPGRFRPGFHVAELGFGTGLNLCAALQTWREAGVSGPLRFTSFERFPMALSDMARALAAFPDLAEVSEDILGALGRDGSRIERDDLIFELVPGDARDSLPGWSGIADAWFLDGFAPARNPELWEPGLIAEVARHTRPGGTAATYSAAGAVRSGLANAGFGVERIAGCGRKRHMTVARLR